MLSGKDKDGNEAYDKFREAVGEARLRLVGPAKSARKDVNRLKKLQNKAKQRGNTEAVKAREKQIQERMNRFSRLYSKRLFGKEDF